MDTLVYNPSNVESAEIVIGIPSYNEADSIALPTDAASRGLEMYFADKSAVIINVDNHSPDNTRKAFLQTPTRVPKIYISTPPGITGKGENLRNLFEAAVELQARAIVVVDADLKNMSPHWIQYLVEPIYAGFDFVSPIYIRHQYDGSITNHVAYPLLRTLYGLRVRQPIGGDVGFSGRMARVFLSEKLWTESTARFGIDIWMTTIAIARKFKVCQTFLGTIKSHRKKDPLTELGDMFSQVVSTIFDQMIEFEYLWKETTRSLPSSIFGFGLGSRENPSEIQIDKNALHRSFLIGFKRYAKIWQRIISQPQFVEIGTLKNPDTDNFYYHSDLWARILFDFAIAYRNNEIPRKEILDALQPFYHSRLLSFINKTSHMDLKECEEYFESITRIFESEKFFLIKRWDQDQLKLGHLLFKHKVNAAKAQ